jgi:hypothetical protein
MYVANMFLQLTKAKQNPDRPVIRCEFMDQVTSLASLRLSKLLLNPLTPNDLWRRRAVSPLKIKIIVKIMSEKQKNTPIIHSVY